MDYKRIQIESIGIGLSNIYNLDLTKDNYIRTYLAVGELFNSSYNVINDKHNLNHIHNFLVTDKGVGINTTRSNVIENANNSLIVSGNILCKGTINAQTLILSEDINVTNNLTENIKAFNQVLNRLSSHLFFYNVKDYLQNNIYTTFNFTIGDINNANNNKNALKISRHCNNNYNNIQFVIQNNDNTFDEASRISMGIIGNINTSPAHIITSKNMPIHFNISKTNSEINNLYQNQNLPEYSLNNYPSLAIDTNNSVLINLDKIKNKINYDKYDIINENIIITKKFEYPNLYVNGLLYADTILIYDYKSQTAKNLDSIYIRQGIVGGLSLYAEQIRGGNFNKEEFIFNSNVYIGNFNNKYLLKIYGNANITDELNTNIIKTNDLLINNNLIVNSGGFCDFNNDCFFSGGAYFNSINCDNSITTKTLNITDKLLYNGTQILFNNLSSQISTTNAINFTITNGLNVGGQIDGITDTNYNSQIINIYKYKDNQKSKFELYLNDTTITQHGSEAYIGHAKLNVLNNEIDNSLIILTQYNTTWNNIYFYAGKDKSKIIDIVPNLSILENDKIGINTIKPEKTLDINGDIITSKYHIRILNNNYECKIPIIYNNYNNIENLNINIDENKTIISNPKKLNIIGGINSYDGYYENNNKLLSIKYIDNTNNTLIENVNLGLGININNDKITIPLQIINTNINNNKINNSIICFYRSNDNSKYSGIEFCDDSTNLQSVNNNKWYIYKNHITDDINYVGPLQIGYMKNSYNPKKSCINLYYDNDKYYIDINNDITYNSQEQFNKRKELIRINGNIKITGDIDLDGSINIKGNYKFNDNNILFSPNPIETIINKIYSLGNNIYYFDTILSPNHPKKISYKNSNIAYNTYINILEDKLNLNNLSNLKYSYSNFLSISNNYLLNSNIYNNNINYSNSIINYKNLNINYQLYNRDLNIIFTENKINNYNLLDSFIKLNGNYIINQSIIKTNSLSNSDYSFSNYRLSSNIYDLLSNIYNLTNTYSNISLNLINFTSNSMILSSNNLISILNGYSNIDYNSDIIIKIASNNLQSTSNIYLDTRNYHLNISNIKKIIENNNYLLNANNDIINMSNNFILTNNYYNSIKNIQIIDFINPLNSNYYYAMNNSNNLDFLYSKLFINSNLYNISKNISLNISEILLNKSDKIYKSISTDKNSYLIYATNNNTIASNNYSNISNITNDIINYSNLIIDITNNSNIINTHFLNISNLKIHINDNNNSNHYFFRDNYDKNLGSISNNIYNYSLINNNYSSNINYISSNIFNTLSNVYNYINIYLIKTINNKSIINTLYNNSSNIFHNLINIYGSNNYIIDINNIINTANINKLITSNINIITSNFYYNISNIERIINNDKNLSSNNMIFSSNNYVNSSFLYNNRLITPLYTILSNNSNNALNILNNTNNIYTQLIDTPFYNELSKQLTYSNDFINNRNIINDNIISTSKIINAINIDINSYLLNSLENKDNTSNLDLIISAYNPDYNTKLEYYQTIEEIKNGINKIILFIKNKLLIDNNNYKLNIINLFDDYKYILDIDIEIYDKYKSLLLLFDFCINLIKELDIDIINIYDNINNNNNNDLILELILHITNKYINFINNSFKLANEFSLLIEILNNYIDIYISTSLSIIPVINKLIEYGNNYLNFVWNEISQNIILFASASYSMNSLIGSMPSITNLNEGNGQNTDVLIIGNNIKFYPNKSLLLGFENEYSKWLETIDDINKSIPVYIYNSTLNNSICSFNCKAQKFISTPGNITSLKTTTGIDINLIDTSIKNYELSMFDGVSLKYSHIFNRDNIYDTNVINNSLFEIKQRNSTKSYLSCYTTINNNNIINIGGGTFYDDINYKCLIENTVVHINQDTSSHLLKLTNPSINPVSISFTQNNINNWDLKINHNFSFNYNQQNILNINSNSILINSINNNISSTLYINSFNNKTALELKNNYSSINPIIIKRLIKLEDKLSIVYDDTGIKYIKKPDIDDYDISTILFTYNSNISFDNIQYRFTNIKMNYNNINNTNPFSFNIINNKNIINLLPILNLNDPKLSYINNNFTEISKSFAVGSISFTIYYHIPNGYYSFTTTEIIISAPTTEYDLLLNTRLQQNEASINDYTTITINYIINQVKIRNIIEFNKYAPFNVETLDVILMNYSYNLQRIKNIIPINLYKNIFTNTINKIQNDNIITINNNIDYLKDIIGKNKISKTYTENKLKLYPVIIFGYKYNIPIEITINDNYQTYGNNEIEIDYINTNSKIPLIKQNNIYNNSHNIYSYTDDYEIYLNNNKLINIDSIGTLTTAGNIETNNIYLTGDIFNKNGISLYDNILSLINNISTEANFELNTKNIILNPIKDNRNSYKGGILINGNNMNNKNNNLFQINNFSDNDNFITLNSCTENSYIHFNNKVNSISDSLKYNSIYRIGGNNQTFGIWKMKDNKLYDNNYFIDTNNDIYVNAMNFNYNIETNNFSIYINGSIYQSSDIQLKTDIKKIDNALTKICSLQGITYSTINDNNNNKRETGLIAQEVNEILPEAISINNEGYLNIAYGNLAGIIIEAIKELKKDIDDIKLRI